MVQLGSGVFECSVDNEFILSGQIRFLNDTNLGSTEDKSTHLDKTLDDFYLNVSENEIHSILKNNRFNLGFKNIKNFKIYKDKIQGSVKWNNDWINFLEGLFKFPYLEHLGTGSIEIPVYIREMCIIPSLFESHLEKGTYIDKH